MGFEVFMLVFLEEVGFYLLNGKLIFGFGYSNLSCSELGGRSNFGHGFCSFYGGVS